MDQRPTIVNVLLSAWNLHVRDCDQWLPHSEFLERFPEEFRALVLTMQMLTNGGHDRERELNWIMVAMFKGVRERIREEMGQFLLAHQDEVDANAAPAVSEGEEDDVIVEK